MKLATSRAVQLDALSVEGNALYQSGKYEAAIERWRQAFDLLPDPKTDWEASTWLFASIGDAYYQQGELEDAKAAFFDALNCPDGQINAFIHYRLGQSLFKLGEKDRAVEHLLRAYMLDGDGVFVSDEDEGREFLAVLRDRNLLPTVPSSPAS